MFNINCSHYSIIDLGLITWICCWEICATTSATTNSWWRRYSIYSLYTKSWISWKLVKRHDHWLFEQIVWKPVDVILPRFVISPAFYCLENVFLYLIFKRKEAISNWTELSRNATGCIWTEKNMVWSFIPWKDLTSKTKFNGYFLVQNSFSQWNFHRKKYLTNWIQNYFLLILPWL